MAANGNSGNSTGQSAASAQAAAAAGNAAASNAANGNTGAGNTSNTSGNTSNSSTSTNTSTNTSTGATNSAGLMGSLIGFGNAVAKGEVSSGSGSGSKSDSKSDGKKSIGLKSKFDQLYDAYEHLSTSEEIRAMARSKLPESVIAAGDEAYTKARAEGKTEAEAQYAARRAVRGDHNVNMFTYDALVNAFKGKNTGPTYNPAVTAQANTNPTIAAGSSEMGPSNAPAANNAPGGNIGGETGGIAGSTETGGTETAAPSVSDASNTGVTYRGGTVSTPSGTSVTESGTGGSISSMPSRDASSLGLGVYNTDRANYDQDNWNRGMEAESSSLVSDEECKAFAKRAFMENSEPFKVVRTTILKRC